jgi:baculoviral IAP repeat-containing protein 6
MLLYRLLSSLDKFYISEREKQKEKDNARVTTSKNRKEEGAGVGFGQGFPGFSPTQYFIPQPHPVQPTAQQQPQPQQPSMRDEQLKSFFRGVGWIFHGFLGEVGVLELMRLSLLSNSVEELLRNDSITDCCERAPLYAAFLTGLEGIGRHSLLSAGFFGKRDGVEYSDGIEKIIKGEGKFVRGKGETPLLEVMEKLGKQADTFSKTAGKISSGLNTADANVVNSINFCRSILGVQQLLQATSAPPSQFTIPPTPTPPTPTPSNTEAYRLACAALAYDEFPPTVINIPYHYHTESTTPTNINPKRTLTLAKELSTMATSLPPGIFVRSLPNRPDCIKALIAGPEGTPYVGGLWEFDIFAGGGYPAEPPKVYMTTTAGGRVRFNPNLYAYSPSPN